jgi:hypothetical protein
MPPGAAGSTPAAFIPTRLVRSSELFSHYVDRFLVPYHSGTLKVDDARFERSARNLLRCDDVGDRLARWFHEARPGEGRRSFEAALEQGIEAVPKAAEPLRDFFAEVDVVPSWVDFDSISRGGALMRRGDRLLAGLSGVALGFYYSFFSPNSARALYENGANARNANRRLVETVKYVADVSGPDALRRFGAGFKTSCRVRLVHSFVRERLRRAGTWDEHIYGVPVSATDQALAILVDSALLVTAMLDFGCRMTPDEIQDIVNLSGYAGHLLGVPDELRCRTFDEVLELMYVAVRTQATFVDPDMTRALVDAFADFAIPTLGDGLVKRVGGRLRDAYVRHMWGDDISDRFGIGGAWTQHAFKLVPPLIHVRDAVEDRFPRVRRWRDASNARFWAEGLPRLLEEMTGSRETRFEHEERSAGSAPARVAPIGKRGAGGPGGSPSSRLFG